MQSVDELRRMVSNARSASRRVALIPTMGALHAGHLSLIQAAVASGACTVVSIYVNPTQFGPHEDFSHYPRTLDADRALCQKAGVDLIFAPNDAEMYPPGDQTRVRPGPLADGLCGPFRPGHFEGVSTVVAKLFNMVQPDAAYFGQKDAQQAAIIRRMALDLAMPVEIVVCPTVREADGLAISSRNVYLTPERRRRAVCLYAALAAGQGLLHQAAGGPEGSAQIDRVLHEMRQVLRETAGAGPDNVTVDYLEIVDAESLERPPAGDLGRGRLLLAGAIRIGGTRLIDNLVVDLESDRQ